MGNNALAEIEREEEESDNKMTRTPITILNTNARSLCPKIQSFIYYFEEMDALIGVVTETWLVDGEKLEGDMVDLAAGTGIGMIVRVEV